jgi:FtsH-binding integral membrane protein
MLRSMQRPFTYGPRSEGLTAYDTQHIKEQYTENFGSEANSKLAVWGALSLYLNFINIFQLLLNFMGQREE